MVRHRAILGLPLTQAVSPVSQPTSEVSMILAASLARAIASFGGASFSFCNKKDTGLLRPLTDCSKESGTSQPCPCGLGSRSWVFLSAVYFVHLRFAQVTSLAIEGPDGHGIAWSLI